MKNLNAIKTIPARGSVSLGKYLMKISREETITMEEEATLTRKIQKGDERALEKLIKANLRFVVSVAKQYQNQGLSLPDLINEGNLGLIKAAKRFDPSKGFKFMSYAVWWIRQSILQALSKELSKVIELPIDVMNDRLYSENKNLSDDEPFMLGELFGIWKNRKVTLDKIREKQWGKRG